MTVTQLAEAMNKDIDHVFEAMLIVDNADIYDMPESSIDNIQVIREIVKKSGLRSVLSSPPRLTEHQAQVKDAVRRPPPDPSEVVHRPPVVTIMGHVDHGKTTLLDALRHSSIVSREFGGITQHIGAFNVILDNKERITFLDTPGHAAFSAMRSRGAHVTDIVVLVVAADDGVMEQTIESIKYAMEAGVSIVVAINKIDKPNSDIEETKRGLLQQGIQLEDFGGDIQSVPISALQGKNLSLLTETILTQAELLELRADPRGMVEGVVVESRTDVGRGKLCTAIVQRGTLRKGAVLVAGTSWAKVRNMFDDRGQSVKEAPPSTPVGIIGWRDLPSAGDDIIEVESESRAREVTDWRKRQKALEKDMSDLVAIENKLEEHLKEYRKAREEKLKKGIRYKAKTGPREKEIVTEETGPKLSVIVKGDVDGSVEAILDVLDTYHSSQCSFDIIHYGVGNITESDVDLASSFEAVVYGFNVTLPPPVKRLALGSGVPVKQFNIIYKMINDMKDELTNRLPPQEQEENLGEATVLQEFIVTELRKKYAVAGCRCVRGVLKKAASFRLRRGSDIVFEGSLASMRHLKAEVNSIKNDVECGLRLDDPSIRFEPGDVIECFQKVMVPQVTDWDVGF